MYESCYEDAIRVSRKIQKTKNMLISLYEKIISDKYNYYILRKKEVRL